MSRKYYFILETVIGFAALIAIDQYVVKQSSAFFGVSPHPYWLVILLIACRYGTFQGLFAGGVAAICYIYLASNTQEIDFSHFTFPHGPYKLPFFFILVGGVLGEIRNIHKKLYLKLEKQYNDKKKDLEDLGVEHEALAESKQELDKRIAFQSTTMVSLFERLTNLEQLEPKSLYKKIPDLLKEQLNVSRSSIYLIKNNKLRLETRQGQNPDGDLPNAVELTEGMMGEVVKTKGLVTINQMFTNDDFKKFDKLEMIMSAPILRKDEALIGVINVEKIPFFDFNANTVRIFEMLAYWISIVVDQAMQFQHLKDKNIADEITGAYNYLHFQKRLTYEIARAKRFHSPLSLLLLEIKQFEKMDEAEKKNVLVVLNWIFSNILREIDIIAKYKNENTFAIILPGQNSLDSEKVIQRLTTEINSYKLKPFDNSEEVLAFEIGTSTLQISEGAYESLVRSAEERLKAGGMRAVTEIYDDLEYLLNLSPGG